MKRSSISDTSCRLLGRALLLAQLLGGIFAIPMGAGGQEAEPAAQGAAETSPARGPVLLYRMESVEIVGTHRMDAEGLREALGLVDGLVLSDDFVMRSRAQLLALGLFENVTLAMKRGSRPGWAKLVVEVEDDRSVLTPWALGADVAVSFEESQTTEAAQGSISGGSLRTQLGLIARNLYRLRHRASARVDLDSSGVARGWHAAYGLPRLTQEAMQFDARVHALDGDRRFLESSGFGLRADAIWSQVLSDAGSIQLGATLLTNRPSSRFRVSGYPQTLAGPRIGFVRETRLLGFFPAEGSTLSAGLVLPPAALDQPFAEVYATETIELLANLAPTVGVRAFAVGVDALGTRLRARLDLPFGRPARGSFTDGSGLAFVEWQGGLEIVGSERRSGAALMVGARYHSAGIIAELGLRVESAQIGLQPGVEP